MNPFPWTQPALEAPRMATAADIPRLNELFSGAFTDRYRRDGMAGVRVPPLGVEVWRYALQDAGEGALCWSDAQGRLAAFNMVHRSGTEGWMGPLCVRPDLQGAGVGRQVVRAGIDWLRAQGATVIGLETMPRTPDNIGFYARLGFVPGGLTLTVTLEAARDPGPVTLLSTLSAARRAEAVAACRALTARVAPGIDFTREIELTGALAVGDTVMLGAPSAPDAFALCHSAPLVDGRFQEELRVLKVVCGAREAFADLLGALTRQARAAGMRRVAVRVQGNAPEAFRAMVALGGRVRWSDLRMALADAPERPPVAGLLLSNWEI
ncbi:MAG: GNAT family N-acetyltransferase [Gemmatimonadetes bacterium]|nr:GNAT family N-acetyltransferase [Gemmatimonadota bacterium]